MSMGVGVGCEWSRKSNTFHYQYQCHHHHWFIALVAYLTITPPPHSVPSLPGVFFPDVLLAFHRDGLTPGFIVRNATDADEEQVMDLTEGLPTQNDVMSSFRGEMRGGM